MIALLCPGHSDLLYRYHTNTRQRLVQFYQIHDPSKLKKVDKMMDSYAGNEELMFQRLERKYLRGEHEPDDEDEIPSVRQKAIDEARAAQTDRIERRIHSLTAKK